MDTIPKDSALADSWLIACVLRCCPPDAAKTEPPDPDFSRHLAICPICRREKDDRLPLVRLDLPAADTSRKQPPSPGELWSLSPSLAGWGAKNRYYSPPVVLVTGPADKQAVRVLQTFGDPALSGPDDILFDNDLIGFVEIWNRYTLTVNDLGERLGKISEECLALVHEAASKHHAEPEPGSLLWFFRQMEVETGWYFAKQSLAGLLGASPLPDALANTRTLLADLSNLPLLVPQDVNDDSLADILARTMPADDLLPLAAADDEEREVQILCFTAAEGKIQKVQAMSALVNLQNEQDNMLRISGLFNPDQVPAGKWFFRWHQNGEFIEPLPGQFGAEDGVFWTVFPTDSLTAPEQGELIIRVLAAE